ncbi:MAG: biotin--[acetyl-CoA-carboxylase] ligase [Pseudomonadota bacterium]
MTSWPEGYDRLTLDLARSTNAEAARLGAEGPRTPTWIMARRQVGGRGRQGRRWEMAPGNLAATLLTFPSYSPEQAGLRSFVAALAVADLFAALAVVDVRMKWPNDVILRGGKGAGILLESASNANGLAWLAVGIGVNLISVPEEVEPGTLPPTSVVGVGGMRTGQDEALAILATAWDHWDKRLEEEGFEPIRTTWLSRAARVGEEIEARLPDRSVTGVFEDVDETGALVLRTPTGVERITAADVFFPG